MTTGQEIAVTLMVLVIVGSLATFITLGRHYGLFREEGHSWIKRYCLACHRSNRHRVRGGFAG